MQRHWIVFILGLLLLSACSNNSETPKPSDIEMSIKSPSNITTAMTTTTSALQVVGLVNLPGIAITYRVNGGEEKPATVIDNAFAFLATLSAGKNTISVKATFILYPQIYLIRNFDVIYQPTVSGGLVYDGVLDPNGPTMTRPDDGGGLSDEERTSPYHAYTFFIADQDWYSIYSAQLYDGYLLLYQGSFNPANPLENLIGTNDDFQGGFDPNAEIPGRSRIRAELEPGQYVVVTTAYSTPFPEENLSFSNNISKTDPPPPPFQLPLPDNSKFNITIRFLSNNVTAEQQAVFVDAANRWASIISADLSNIDLGPDPVEINPDAAAITGVIDDILIDASFTDIDGPGSILGRAGPQFIRTSGDDAPLTIYGIMEFDVAEFAPGGFFDDPKGYADVILHEMGHVLGIGTLWNFTGNLEGFDPNAPTNLPLGIPNPDYDPRFIGAGAVQEYQALLSVAGKPSETGVPVENTGGRGSINSHWRELTFDNELMSPAASGSESLSKLTAASLGDLGYTVNLGSSAIDSYVLPPEGTFVQNAPNAKTYVYLVDFLKLSGSVGSATGTVQGVDLKIDEAADPTNPASNHPANATSGCEPEDFAGFTPGHIALVQRGFCAFVDKVANAEAAGAIGVIIFNQGNDETPARRGLFGAASTGLPGVSVPFELGVELAGTSGLNVSIDSGLPDPSALSLAAQAPKFDEEVLLPIGTISSNGKFNSLPRH